MALVIEDGTGKVDSNTYASVVDADLYLAARGYTVWAPLQNAEKENALVRATDHMRTYGWKGSRTKETQAQDWPRNDVVVYGNQEIANNVIPVPIKSACIELAFRAAGGPLAPDGAYDETGRLMTKLVKKVGPIVKEQTYAARGPMASPALHRKYPAVEVLVAPFVEDSMVVYR